MNPLHKITIGFTGILHPLLYAILIKISKISIKPFSVCEDKLPQPCIFVCNHTNSHDIPTFCMIIKRHIFVLAGKENLRFADRITYHLNGVIFIDRSDKNSRSGSKDRMLDMLKGGHNILIFPEGSWNMTDNMPMLPLHWGVVDIARKSKVPIVPVVLEYIDSECLYS